MTLEELKKEAMDYANKWLEEVKNLEIYHNKADPKPKYIRIKEAYFAGAEPREKQIEIDAKQIRALQKQNGELTNKVKELEAQIEKLIDFVLSKIECCDVCPITDTCINSEGTCPYAGILAKGEEVTREWLMQFISKEIKEK